MLEMISFLFSYGSFKGEGVWIFLCYSILNCNHKCVAKFDPMGIISTMFGRGPLDDPKYQIWKLLALWFQTRFLKIAFLKPISDTVTYLYNHPEPFDQLW